MGANRDCQEGKNGVSISFVQYLYWTQVDRQAKMVTVHRVGGVEQKNLC
jgi:hypothetical protein